MNRADVAAVFQADIPPIAAAIDGLINAVAIGDIAAQRRLAGAGVDRVVIARRDREGADRRSGMLLVEHRLPVGAAVGGFPHTTSDCAEIIGVRLIRDAFDRDPAAAPETVRSRATSCRSRAFRRIDPCSPPWLRWPSSRSWSIVPQLATGSTWLILPDSFFSVWLRLCSLGQKPVRKPKRRLRVRVGRP